MVHVIRHDGTVSVAAFSFATKRCVTMSSGFCAGVDRVSAAPLNEPSTILVRSPLGPPQLMMVFWLGVRDRVRFRVWVRLRVWVRVRVTVTVYLHVANVVHVPGVG